MTKQKDIPISCRNCKFSDQSTDWLWEKGIIICTNENSDHFGHILTRNSGCGCGEET